MWTEFENRPDYRNVSDVLWPTRLPDDEHVRSYFKALEYSYSQIFRNPNRSGTQTIFSSESGRSILEQELLKAGAFIRTNNRNLNEYQRPLGNMVLEGLGFGSLIVSYRNCPNNAPLAFWAGNPPYWYNLFPRKAN